MAVRAQTGHRFSIKPSADAMIEPLFFLFAGLGVFASLVVLLENTTIRLSRGRYARRMLAYLAVILFWLATSLPEINIYASAEALRQNGNVLAVPALAAFLLSYRAMVQRLRDGGDDRTYAYCALIPGVAIVIMVLLAFTPRSMEVEEI